MRRLTAAWRAVRWLAARMTFCLLLFDLIKEVHDAVQDQRRAAMRGN